MAYREDTLALNPRAYWRLGELSGTSALDETANANKALYNGTPTLGQAGPLVGDPNTAVLFNAAGNYCSAGTSTSLDVADSFTYRHWIRRASASGLLEILNSKGGGTIRLQISGTGALALVQVGASTLVTSTITITDTNWHHVVAVKDVTRVEIWVDGVNVTGTVSNLTATGNTSTQFFGGTSGTSGNVVFGSLDEFAIFGYGLSATQIAADRNSGLTDSIPPAIPTGLASSIITVSD